MNIDDMDELQRRLHNAAIVAESDGDEWGHANVMRDAIAEIQRLSTGHRRYETARRMNPRAWNEAWNLNVRTGKPFDEIVDDLRPFMGHNAQVNRPQKAAHGGKDDRRNCAAFCGPS